MRMISFTYYASKFDTFKFKRITVTHFLGLEIVVELMSSPQKFKDKSDLILTPNKTIFPNRITDILLAWCKNNSTLRPSKEHLLRLAKETGLTPLQISCWFSSRVRVNKVKKGMLTM